MRRLARRIAATRPGWTAALLLAAMAQVARAQEAPRPDAEKKAEAAPPAKVKVEKGHFKVEVALPGVLESAKAVEVSIRPKAWAQPLVVDRAAELGSPAKEGDLLVEFDRSKIDKAIQDAEAEEEVGGLALKLAREELPALEKLLPLDLAAAERAKAQADEDLDRFVRIDRPNATLQAEFSVKSASEYLEYAREELKQLQQMYRSKDLTEETEEIILRRTRFQVESSEFRLRQAEKSLESTLKVQLPRQEVRVREAAARQALELQKARAALPLTLGQKRAALAKLEHDRARAAERLADLRADREAMTVRAPADGLVYYGRADRGTWQGASAMGAKLRKGGTIAPDEVFITVASPRPTRIRATVEEKDLAHLAAPGELKGRASVPASPDATLPARLSRLVSVPREAGKFDVVAELEPDAPAGRLRPGMACTLKFTPYRKADALTLPASSVFEDEDDDGSPVRVVYKPAAPGGKPEKKAVKVGKASGGRVEILEGLAAGDEVLAAKP